MIDITTASLDHEHFQAGRGKELFTPVDGRFWCCKEIEGITTPDAAYGGGPGSTVSGVRYLEMPKD